MTEQERKEFNCTYKKHASYTAEIVEAASKITKPLTAELDACMEKIIMAVGQGNAMDMSLDELENAVLKIPALCYYLQNKLGEYSLRGTVDEILNDCMVIEELEKIRNDKGDAREKMKRAEASCTSDRVVEALNKQICINLRESISRADKVYEGIKKILDARVRENEYNRKSQMFST